MKNSKRYKDARYLVAKLDQVQQIELSGWAVADREGEVVAGIDVAQRKWDNLSDETKELYDQMLTLHAKYVFQAIEFVAENSDLPKFLINKRYALREYGNDESYALSPYISNNDF